MAIDRYKDGGFWKWKGHADVPVGQAESQPIAPTSLSGNSITDTGVTLTWTKSVSTGITAQRIYRNNSLYATINDNTTQTLVVTDLVTLTPYTWKITAFNGTSGINSGYSNTYSMTTTGTVQTFAPNAPGSFTAVKNGAAPTTSILATWAAPATDGTHNAATGYRVYVNGVQNGADLGAVLTKNITGLSPNTSYTITVRAFNGTGAGPSTSGINVTTDNVSSGNVMLMGTSLTPKNIPHGGFAQWDVVRVYDFATAKGSQVQAMSPKRLGVTNSGTGLQSGASAGTTTEAFLEDFYYGSGSSSRNTQIVDVANGNEYAKNVTNVTSFVQTTKAMSDAVHKMVGGVRRYPLANMVLDPTTDQERTGSVQASLHPAAQYLDGVAWSMYPPSRDKPTAANPTFDNPNGTGTPNQFMERCIQRTISAGNAAGKELFVCIWEIGIGDDPADQTHRPYYACHSLARWFYERCLELGISPEYAIWWDQMKVDAGAPQNEFANEPGTANPSTAAAWRNWTNYVPEYGGTKPAQWANNPRPTSGGGITWPTGA